MWVGNPDAQARYDVCKQCIPLTAQCQECGYFMKIKVKFEVPQCPLNKW